MAVTTGMSDGGVTYRGPDGVLVKAYPTTTSPVASSASVTQADWRSLAGESTGPIPVPEAGKALATNPEFATRMREYNFLEASYRGGPQYRNALDAWGEAVLVKHEPNESEDAFRRRKKLAIYRNYCKPIVRKFNAFVFRQEIQREQGDTAFADWCLDVDLQGTRLHEFMRACCRKAQVFGRYYVQVDSNRPLDATGLTRAQADAMNIRLFLVPIDPRRVLDWRSRNGQLVEALVVYGQGEMAILWTETEMHVVALNQSGEVTSVQSSNHGRKGLPIVEIQPFEDGESQVRDIAELNRDIFNLDGLLHEEIFQTTYTQWWGIGVDSSEIKDAVFGPSRLICLRNPQARLEKTGGDPAQAQSIRQSIADDTREIYRLAGLKAEDPLEVGATKSGVALRVEFDDLDAILSSIADAAERAENRIIELYNEANGSAVRPSNYPDKFGTPDVAIELTRSLDVLGSSLLVPTAKLLECRRINSVLHPKATPEEKGLMDHEAEEMYSPEALAEKEEAQAAQMAELLASKGQNGDTGEHQGDAAGREK